VTLAQALALVVTAVATANGSERTDGEERSDFESWEEVDGNR
jgi:hypothetical protein